MKYILYLSEFLQFSGPNTETSQQNLEIPEDMPAKDDGKDEYLSRLRKKRYNEVV